MIKNGNNFEQIAVQRKKQEEIDLKEKQRLQRIKDKEEEKQTIIELKRKEKQDKLDKKNKELEIKKEKKRIKEEQEEIKKELTLEEKIKYKYHKLELIDIINKDKINAKLYDLNSPKHICKFDILTTLGEEHIFERIYKLFNLTKEELFIERSSKELEDVPQLIKDKINKESKNANLYRKLCTYIDKYNVKMKFLIKKITENDINIILYTEVIEDSIDTINYNGSSYTYYHKGKHIMKKKMLEDIFI